MIDGEIVAFDADGRPSFNALQNQGSTETPILYVVFQSLRERVKGRGGGRAAHKVMAE